MLQVKTFVVKFIAIYTQAPSAVSLDTGVKSVLFSQIVAKNVYIDTNLNFGHHYYYIDSVSNLDKIAALNHKIFDNPMKRAIFVTNRVSSGSEHTFTHQNSGVV